MKELSIEQKAKAYDEAREKIALRFGSNVAEEIFSEFEMNEYERIRGAIIDHLKDNNLTEWADWLEKQGEQKAFNYENVNIQQKDFAPQEDVPRYNIGDVLCDKSYIKLSKGTQSNFKITDIRNGLYICDKCSFPISQQDEYELVANKIEPKFKVGDWCIDNEDGTIFQIVKVLDNTYTYKTNEGKEYSCTRYSLENDAKLWTIQDAKDGDVLADKYNNIGIFQECKGICWHSYIYLGCDGELRGFNIGGSHEQTGTHPATKEQRDLLFQKMKEVGYEWDAEKKEVKKIEVEECEQKSVLNKDEKLTDDYNFQHITDMIKRYSKYCWDDEFSYNILNWFKSLKNRIK